MADRPGGAEVVTKSDLPLHLEDMTNYEVREYSGRGMMGRNCLAVTTDESVTEFFVELMVNVAEAAIAVNCPDASSKTRRDEWLQSIREKLLTTRQDQLGKLGNVFYWPNVRYVNDEEEV